MPPSLKFQSPPSASRTISPPESIVISPASVIVEPSIDISSTVILPAVNSPAVTVIFPVEVPVAVVVPTKKLSADSSHIRQALSPVEPLSKTNPKSLALEPAPVFNSINGSACVSTVDETTVCVPDTVKFPVTVKLPANVAFSELSAVKNVESLESDTPVLNILLVGFVIAIMLSYYI